MRPIYTAFYTRGTRYEQEAARLQRSLDVLGLPHDIRAVDDRGNWMANTQLTAGHVWAMLEAHPDRPVIQLDADAVVWRRPDLFEDGLIDADLAVHYRRGRELLNGTVWFAPTAGARLVARRYLDLIQANAGCTNEQTMLAKAIEDLAGLATIYRLPAEYTWIHDIMAMDLAGAEPVIEHLQASRVATNSSLLPNRVKRLAEIAERLA